MEQEEVKISNGNGLQKTEMLFDRIMAVCYVETVFRDVKTGKERLKRGTGFFSKLNLEGYEDGYGVFTNNHVLGTVAEAENAVATFGYEGSNVGEKVKLRPKIMFRTQKELDYTFVGVNKKDIDNLKQRIEAIPMEPEPELRIQDSIMIFQHPKGRGKEYSQDRISNIEKPFVFYQADTETGSSGSPVLTTVGLKLIAIHHKGSEEGGYNKGTLISEVLMHLEKGTYTKLSGSISDSQDKEIFEDAPPGKKPRYDQEDVKKGMPSEEALGDLAQHITPFWKPLGRKLKVPNSKLEEIQSDNVQYPSVKEKAFQMLMVWIDLEESPTFSELSRALQALGKNRLAQEHCISHKS